MKYNMDYAIEHGWLKDLKPVVLQHLSMSETRTAGIDYVKDMRFLNKSWHSRKACRAHFLKWLEKRIRQ